MTPPETTHRERIIYSTLADLELADRALVQRPRFSIRLRVALGFMATFILICIMTLAAVVFFSKLGVKQLFIEKADSYAFEIQQARRFEKNFLLYGTNLDDALTFVGNAQNILKTSHGDFSAIIGEKSYRRMAANLRRYGELLGKISALESSTDPSPFNQRNLLQSELRRVGAGLVADAASAIAKERLSFHSWLRSAKIIAASALIFIFIFEIYIVTFIARQIFLPFKRFDSYMHRIAAGDFSPVTPVKKYQDEFTDLAVAINRMLKEIQERGNQLVESRKMAAIGALIEGIAHEINNPLNNISLTVDALLDGFDGLPEEEQLDMLKEIFAQVERAGATVANLLEFTQRDQSAFKPLHIGDILASTAALLGNELASQNIAVEILTQENLPKINGHYQNLQQVFFNLFLNAKEAMPDGGRLTVRSDLQGEFVRIAISDTGDGIPQENLNRIFDPFFTTKEVGKGTGLGLSVSFGIIEKHHGAITAQSEVGQGTTITVLLRPCAM